MGLQRRRPRERAGDLPAKGPINALREDYDNPNLLFAGTEFGLFLTVDGGRQWKPFKTGMPSVRVDDILIHPRDRDLIVATHGRSIYIADDITPLEQLKAPGSSDLALFEPRPAILWKNDPQAQRRATNRDFKGQNPQGGTAIHVWANSDMGKGKLEFLQGAQVVSTMEVEIKAGMNRFQWNLRGPAPQGGRGGFGGRGGGQGGGGRGQQTGVPFVSAGGGGFGGPGGPIVQPGSYMVRLTVGSQTLTSSVTVLEDVWMRAQ